MPRSDLQEAAASSSLPVMEFKADETCEDGRREDMARPLGDDAGRLGPRCCIPPSPGDQDRSGRVQPSWAPVDAEQSSGGVGC
jgi:hypothetical protein